MNIKSSTQTVSKFSRKSSLSNFLCYGFVFPLFKHGNYINIYFFLLSVYSKLGVEISLWFHLQPKPESKKLKGISSKTQLNKIELGSFRDFEMFEWSAT